MGQENLLSADQRKELELLAKREQLCLFDRPILDLGLSILD